MSTEDNIKKFFEKRLQDATPAADLWNVPSDDIWNKAKEHFPQEKKKRRPFIFFLFGFGALLLVSIGVIYGLTTATPSLVAEEIEQSILLQEEETIPSIVEQEIPQEESTASLSTPDTSPNSTFIKETKSTKTKSNQPISNPTPNTSTPNIIETKKSKNISTNSSTVIPTQSTTVINRLKLEIPVQIIPKLPVLVVTSKEGVDDPKMNYKLSKSSRRMHRWELGISHSPFLINIRKALLDTEDDDEATYQASFKYRNLNIPVTRWFNRKWSLTSGLSYSRLDLDLDFEVEDVYDQIPPDTNADFQLKQIDGPIAGSISVFDVESDLEVTFKQDADIQLGDTLLVKGSLPLEMRVVQLPLLLNYHFGKGKWEGLLHTGMALDFYQVQLRSLQLDIYENDILASNGTSFKSIKDHSWGFSIYLGAGVKYHLNDKFNLGFSTKFDFTDLLLSRHEIGFYYGF